MSGCARIIFSGKIFGTNADYWIASGSLHEPAEANQDADIEPRGTGCNQIVYWVTDNLLNDWIQLPDVKPAHIVAARQIKHIMTGDLNAQVVSNPPFPGKERHYLRAQLARIFTATSISPKGFYLNDEETNKMRAATADEFTMPGTEELKSLEAWANVQKSILKNGRHSYVAPGDLDDEAKEAWISEKNEADPQVDEFRALNEHTPCAGMETAFISKVVGDPQQYTKGEGNITYAVNVIKSVRWPGAVTVAKGGKFTNIYIGYGLKRQDPSFNPTVPPTVDVEPMDPVEQSEPNPEKEPAPKQDPVDDDVPADD